MPGAVQSQSRAPISASWIITMITAMITTMIPLIIVTMISKLVMVVDNRMMIMIESSLSQTLSIKEPVKYAELDDSPIFRSAQHTASASYSRSSVEADF